MKVSPRDARVVTTLVMNLVVRVRVLVLVE